MLFLCWKKTNLVPNKQLLLNVPLQSTKYKKKDLCVDNKVQGTIGDVYCPACRTEKWVLISTNRTPSFYDCKKCKTCCHALNIPFKDQTPTIMLFSGDGTHCFVRKASCDYEKLKAISIFKEISPPITAKHIRTWTKKGRSYYIWGIIVSTPHWLIQFTKTSFILSFHALSVYIKAAQFSQPPMTVLSGLSTLDQIQWLWL